MRVHPPGLTFDVGRGALQLAGAQDVFLTHGHLDHVLGLPYVLSRRSLHRSAHTRVFCPEPIAGAVAELIGAAQRLERAQYRYDLMPLTPGDRVPVGRIGSGRVIGRCHSLGSWEAGNVLAALARTECRWDAT